MKTGFKITFKILFIKFRKHHYVNSFIATAGNKMKLSKRNGAWAKP